MKKALLFEFRSKSATFRVVDGNPPLEEVSVVGKGRFKNRKLTTLYTVRIMPTGKTKDGQVGAGILYLEGNGRASFKIVGRLSSTDRWRERAEGVMSFGDDCSGGLRGLKDKEVSFLTLVDSSGESTTKVWE